LQKRTATGVASAVELCPPVQSSSACKELLLNRVILAGVYRYLRLCNLHEQHPSSGSSACTTSSGRDGSMLLAEHVAAG